jgi:hypothetical protein
MLTSEGFESDGHNADLIHHDFDCARLESLKSVLKITSETIVKLGALYKIVAEEKVGMQC